MTKAQEMLKECGYILKSKTPFQEEYIYGTDEFDYILFPKIGDKVVLGMMEASFDLIKAINARVEEIKRGIRNEWLPSNN